MFKYPIRFFNLLDESLQSQKTGHIVKARFL